MLFLLAISHPSQFAPLVENEDITKRAKTTAVTENDLLEGDMVKDQTVLDIVRNQTGDSKRSATTNGVKLWKNGIVPYIISNQLSTNAKLIIYQAIAKLHASTCVRFKQRTTELNYVEFIQGNGCYSHVGKQPAYRQEISLGTGCKSVGIALHEMVHTLGFFHTSSRTDRDSYVIVYDNNIQLGKEQNFKKYSHGQIDHLNSPYDITSIMHLPGGAFAKSPYLTTIRARAGAHIKLGDTGRLSPVDKYQINSLYKCSLTISTSTCLTALGLQNGAIPDNAITASSQYSSYYKPSAARLHVSSISTMGAWCPRTYYNSWLQIDLGQLVRVTAIATQGREGMSFDEYTFKYNVTYKTSEWSGSWYSYVSSCRAYAGSQSLPGNWDGGSVQYNALTPTFNARYVRLHPKSWTKKPCLRVEVYGCKI